jgi:hypothetical protein
LVDPLLEASLRAFFPYQRLVNEIEERRKRERWRGEERSCKERKGEERMKRKQVWAP